MLFSACHNWAKAFDSHDLQWTFSGNNFISAACARNLTLSFAHPW